MNQIVKKISLTLVVAALASGTLMAQTKGRTVQQPGKVTILPHFSNVQVPFRAEEPDSIDANIVVAKNLGPTGSTYVVVMVTWSLELAMLHSAGLIRSVFSLHLP